MMKVAVDVTVRVGSVVLGAWLCSLFAPMLLGERGTIGPSAFLAHSPAMAVLGVVLALGVATFIGALAGRVTNPVAGVFVLGASLFGLAWRTEGLQEVLLSGSPIPLPAETLLYALLAVPATWIVLRAGGPLKDVEPDPQGHRPNPWLSKPAGMAAASGLLVLPVAWLVAQSPSKGQALGAAFLGAMVAGIAARLVAPHAQPRWAFISPLVFGAVALAIGAATLAAAPAQAFVDRSYSPLLVPMPIDWLAAGLMGAAFGYGWAKSFLHHEETTTEPVRRAVRTSST